MALVDVLSKASSLLTLASDGFQRLYMAKLGPFQFCIDTAAFQDLQRVATYKWQTKERIGRKPAQQFTGYGADTITLNGVIYPHYMGGLNQIGYMREIARSGQPQSLVYAFERSGQYCGRWCIVNVEEKRAAFFADGKPRKIEFSITLVEYGEDGAQVQAYQPLQPSKLSGLLGSFTDMLNLATRIGASSGLLSGKMTQQLGVISASAGLLGTVFDQASSVIGTSVFVADSTKATSNESLAALGDTPTSSGIGAAADIITSSVGRMLSINSQASNDMNAAYNARPTTTPTETSTAMRGAQSNMGELSKLLADSAIAANKIKGSL